MPQADGLTKDLYIRTTWLMFIVLSLFWRMYFDD
jgi:hypothetical protein